MKCRKQALFARFNTADRCKIAELEQLRAEQIKAKTTLDACIRKVVFAFIYSATADTEMERSGIEVTARSLFVYSSYYYAGKGEMV